MQVKVLEEHGLDNALLGLSLSFYDHLEPIDDWWTEEKKIKAYKRANLLAFKGGGHNKFLESIQVWVYVQAARCFWSEFDTYRVGMTKNSSSTMHTLDKRQVVVEDFEVGTDIHIIDHFNQHCLAAYKDPGSVWYKDITRLKDNLPEGWLQEREVCLNYMTLQNIILQRTGHRLKYWKFFIEEILKQVKYPQLLRQEIE
jgi:hypothetical protein